MSQKRISFAKVSNDEGTRSETSQGVFQKFSSRVSHSIGDSFYRLGVLVGSNPWRTIAITTLCVALCSLGFLKFYNERNPVKLWIPKNSKFLHDSEWLMHNFEEGHREQTIIFHSPTGNILESKNLLKILQINREIENFQVTLKNGSVISWNDVCFKIPMIAKYVETERRKRRDLFDMLNIFSSKNSSTAGNSTKPLQKKKPPFNPSVDLNSLMFCTIVNTLKQGCLQDNILEIWQNDPDILEDLTLDEVLRALNRTKNSPVTGHQLKSEPLLSGVVRNESGFITSASTIMENWYVYINFSEIDHNEIGNMAGTEDWATETVLKWEEGFLKVLHRLKLELEDDDFKFDYGAGRSYGDISSAVMFQDIDKLFIGGFLMFVYMQLVLSKFNWVELRFILGSLGLLSVGLAFLASCGICSLLGIFYGPVHTSLPFLLMGLGVDDIFVMMACWRKVQTSAQNKEPIPIRLGLMLKHAGVSITVTSVTDLVAFLVGATTILPSLQSFCLYAGIGVLFTYLLAITMFVAIFALDEQRIEAKRNSLIPCIVHGADSMKHYLSGNLMDRSLKYIYSKFILTVPGKIMVLLLVVGYTGFGMKGLLHLEQKFDPNWFIPESTYLSKFFDAKKQFYPNMGYEVGIYMGNLNYSSHMPELIEISEKLKNETDILHDYNSWIEEFYEFVKIYYDIDMATEDISDSKWRLYLTKFLYSNDGGKYQANIRFATPLQCGKNAPDINVAFLQFKFKPFNSRSEYLPAMKTIEHILADSNITNNDHQNHANNYSTVWGKVFGNWITDEIIDEEVLRNICLALICVMGCTIILIVNFQVCFWIFLCVLLTLVNVGGFMQKWGLTIDLVSCIGLQLAVGLCVDYAAHIGHTFLTIADGTRTERALETVLHIGSAVLYGGGSTVLALSMLSTSDAYTFKSFFKIFLLVILFGLFHGVVFLPVVLSLVGPRPYNKKVKPVDDIQKHDEMYAAAEELLDIEKKTLETNGNGSDNHFEKDQTQEVKY